MRHCTMTDPGAGCGSPTGNTGTEDADDLITFTQSQGRTDRDLVIDGVRVTFGDEDEAAFAALIATASDPDREDETTVQSTELCDVFTMGGDDEDDAAARFTVFDVIASGDDYCGPAYPPFNSFGREDEGSIFGAAGQTDETVNYRLAELVTC